MRYIFSLLMTTFLFSACATNQPQTTGPSLKERIKEARSSVNVVMPNSADWCTATANCSYIADVYCGKESGTKEKAMKKCINKVRNKTVKLGGDTFVMQDMQLTPGQNELFDRKLFYRAFGQIYRCSNKNEALSKEFLATNNGPHKLAFQMVTQQYHTQCNSKHKCKSVRPINCSTVQDTPLKRCMTKMETREKAKTPFNYVVVQRDIFNKMGAYRIYTEAYQCE